MKEMTKSDIGKIIYDRLREYGVNTYLSDNLPYEEITDERIVIIVSRITPSTFWQECYVRIDWCVPDIQGEANSPRMEEIENELRPVFYGCGSTEELGYRYRKDDIDTSSSTEGRFHFVSLNLLFQFQNIK